MAIPMQFAMYITHADDPPRALRASAEIIAGILVETLEDNSNCNHQHQVGDNDNVFDPVLGHVETDWWF